jgi:hypothetical protein
LAAAAVIVDVWLEVPLDAVDRAARNGLTVAGYDRLVAAVESAGFRLVLAPEVLTSPGTTDELREEARRMVERASALDRQLMEPARIPVSGYRCLAQREWSSPPDNLEAGR